MTSSPKRKNTIFSNQFFKLIPTVFFFSLLILLNLGCPKVPIEDTTTSGFRDYPLVEIQINNTETTVDDYVFTSAVSCRARLLNHREFDSEVRVRLKNFNLPAHPGVEIQFRSGVTPSFGSFAFLDLTDDGSWVSFSIRGTAANVSARDKDVVIEMVESRSGASANKNVVLARKALMVTNSPLPSVSPQLEILINGSKYSIDDYVTISPTYCTVKLINHTAFSSPVNIRLQNYSNSIGKLRFSTKAQIDPTPHATVTGATVYLTPTNTTLNVSVPADGTTATFYIAGEFDGSGTGARPSIQDKDAVIEVVDQVSGANYGRWATMVRMRKNGNNLLDEERDRFLEALATLNSSFDAYEPFEDIHSVAADYNHFISRCTIPGCPNPISGERSASSFLPWHRAFILRLEKSLQSLDPSVTLHYWKYDDPAPNIFHADFLGRDIGGAGAGVVTNISMSNPLFTWSTGAGPSLRRNSRYNDQTGAPTNFNDIDHFVNNFGTSITTFGVFRERLEFSSHGASHNESGWFFGQIGSFTNSPNDPLFYMLHSNVDRIWAKWQARGAGRYEPELARGYDVQGTFPNSGTTHVGSFVMDEMWPWNGKSGTGSFGINDYPTTSYGPFPLSPGDVFLVPGKPRPFDMIDYRVSRINTGVTPSVNRGVGYDYDDDGIFVFNPTL